MTIIQGLITADNTKRPMVGLEARTGNIETFADNITGKTKAEVRVCIPGIISAYDPATQTVTVTPALSERVRDMATGAVTYAALPTLEQVPLVFIGGGGFSVTLPIQPGDECLLVFTDVALDNWWASGGPQICDDLRRHDLSDAIAIPVKLSQANKVTTPATDALEIRNTAGTTKLQVKADEITIQQASGKRINISPGITTIAHGSTSITLDGTYVNIVGALNINGSAYMAHHHSIPGGTTGGVTP